LNNNWEVNLTSKQVSKQYLDNTQNEARIVKAYFLQDINTSYKLFEKPKWNAHLQLYVNNIFDKKYEPNGFTYSYLYEKTVTTSNNYCPMAGRNFWVSLKVNLK
jgi:iron complex outermembrane receptor protein